MDIKVVIAKFEETDWFSINVDLKNDGDTVQVTYLSAKLNPECVSSEITEAVNFAKGLLNTDTLTVTSSHLESNTNNNASVSALESDVNNDISDSSEVDDTNIKTVLSEPIIEEIDITVPLNINGLQPVKTVTIQADLDLPDRAEFEDSAKFREVEFLASHLKVEAEPTVESLDQALKYLKTSADTTILPTYIDKINYLSNLLNDDVCQFSDFSEGVVNHLDSLISRSESLPSDVLLSDAESLAKTLNYQLPADQLTKEPFKYFKVLHKEELNASLSNIDMPATEWSQRA